MFGRHKKREAEEKSTIDKIVMGAIIGTAIGSVIGLTVAPKKGEETRQVIKDGVGKNVNELKKLTQETAKGFLKIAKKLLFKEAGSPTPSASSGQKRSHQPNTLKEIPNEMEAHRHEQEQ